MCRCILWQRCLCLSVSLAVECQTLVFLRLHLLLLLLCLVFFTVFRRIECDAVLIFSGFVLMIFCAACYYNRNASPSFFASFACFNLMKMTTNCANDCRRQLKCREGNNNTPNVKKKKKKMVANYEFNFIEIIGAGKIY